jgi:hypothetical protein
MPRVNATVPPDAIRIEDEVWQDAFTRREPAAENRRRLRAIDGGRTEPVGGPSAPTGMTAAPARPARTSAHRTAAAAPRTTTPHRRTVKIQGRGAERNLPLPDPVRRAPRRSYERAGFRPDRLAMWAVMLGFVLVLVAIVSAHA